MNTKQLKCLTQSSHVLLSWNGELFQKTYMHLYDSWEQLLSILSTGRPLTAIERMWTHFAWFHHQAFHLQIAKMRENFQCSHIVFIFSYSVLGSLHSWECLWPEENCNSSLNHHSVFYRTAIIHKLWVKKHHPRNLYVSEECFFQMEICGQDLGVLLKRWLICQSDSDLLFPEWVWIQKACFLISCGSRSEESFHLKSERFHAGQQTMVL